jgi:hypothetical protein
VLASYACTDDSPVPAVTPSRNRCAPLTLHHCLIAMNRGCSIWMPALLRTEMRSPVDLLACFQVSPELQTVLLTQASQMWLRS